MLEILVNYFLTDVLVSFIVISYLIDSFLKNILRGELLISFIFCFSCEDILLFLFSNHCWFGLGLKACFASMVLCVVVCVYINWEH